MFSLQVISNFFAVIFLKNSSFIPYFPIFSLFFSLCTAYAILRYRFLSIQFIIRKNAAFMMSFILYIFIIGYFLFLLVQKYDISKLKNNFGMVIAILFFLGMIFVIVQKLIDYLLKKYWPLQNIDLTALIGKLHWSEDLSNQEQIHKKLPSLCEDINKKFCVRNTVIILKTTDLCGQKTFVAPSATLFTPDRYNTLITLHRRFSSAILTQELLYRGEHELFQKLMKWRIGVVIPLHEKKIYSGLLILGEKLGRMAFSQEEIEKLFLLQRQLQQTIGHILLYDNAIKRMRKMIGERVEEV